jgi:CopG antitoxin of type II toxin-antitoxin system
MNDKKKQIDLLPEEFESYEEAAEFWDNHDTTDYLDEFETVETEVSLKHRRYEIEIDADLMPALTEQAHKRGVAVKIVVSDLLREKLSPTI